MLIIMVPNLSRVAFLENPDNPAPNSLKRIQTAAQRTKSRILPMQARTATDIEQAVSAMARDKAGAVIVMRDPFLNQQVRLIADLAARHKLPSIGGLREFAEAGGLMSYGSSITAQHRRVAVYVDKIFKGAKPADLPVEQPTKFDLVINGKTAKVLGLTIPYALRISATEVIE
jgi:putative ABC transport system substrate-binding protein